MIAPIRFVLASLMLLSSGMAASQQPVADFNADGVDDIVETQVGFDPQVPLTGHVHIRDGLTNDIILQLATGTPNDAFGFAVQPLPDLNGDLVPELVVTAPRARLGTGPVGEAYVYSGADGSLLSTLRGANGDRFGFAVSPVSYLPDGTPLITVEGMALDLQGVPVDRTHAFDAMTGRRVSSRSFRIEGLVPVIVPEGLVWGDINQDENVNTTDVVVLLNQVATGGEPDGGDLNGDESVNATDVGVLASAIGGGGSGGGGPTGPATNPVPAPAWQAVGDALDLWTFLYPEDPISFALGQSSGTTGLVPNWWYASGFRPDGEILASGWFDSAGIDGCSAIVLLDEHNQRARQLTIDTDDQDCSCEADVNITQYPRSVFVDSYFDVCAVMEGDCGSLEWKMDFGETTTGWVPGNACHTLISPLVTGDLPPTSSITVSVRCTACPDVTDSVDIDLVRCAVYTEPVGFVDGGSTFIVSAIGVPEGGTYNWQVVSNQGMVTSLIQDGGPTATVSVRSDSGGGGAYAPVMQVDFLVTYTTANCIDWALTHAVVILDSDGDGIPDQDEDDTGCNTVFDVDADGDGLSDVDENTYGTDPCNSDTDGDTVGDGCEVDHGRDPAEFDDDFDDLRFRDSDHDGLSDFDERFNCGGEGTDELVWDTDGDGISDGCEVLGLPSSDPLDPFDPYGPGDDADTDNDGAPDAMERCAGTSPTNPDTDGDGILDGDELQYMVCCDPKNPDTDNDGLLDGDERDVYGTDPCNIDTDNDGLTDYFELMAIPSDTQGSGSYAVLLDPLVPDTDHNGIPDGDEDLDGDGLSNTVEQLWSTNPLEQDTDGDGQSDAEEIAGDSDPADARLTTSQYEDEWRAIVRMSVHSNGGKGSWRMALTGNTTGRTYFTPVCDFESDASNPAEIELRLRRGESYSVRVLYNRTEPAFWNSTCEHDFSYCATIQSTDPVKWPAILVDEQEDDDPLISCYGTPLLCYDSYKCNPARSKRATLYLPIIDVDIDSDNNGTLDQPSREVEEGDREDDENRNGKLIGFRGGDLDADGVPDSVDGFDLTPDNDDDVVLPVDESAYGFVPVVIEMAGFPPPEQGEEYRLWLQYDASDPNEIVVIDPLARLFELPAGRGRLWTKDQLTQRDKRPVGAELPADAGDFVGAGTGIPVTRLGLTNTGSSTTTLYYEALDHSEAIGDLSIAAWHDDARCIDTVRATVPRFEIVTRSYTADSDEEAYEPFAVVHGSDPEPSIKYEIIDEGPLAPIIDPNTLAITLHADWAVSDPLSGIMDPIDQVEEFRVYVNGQLAHVEPLSGSCAGEEFPFQDCIFEASGTMQLTIPAPISPEGKPRSWGAQSIVVEARTSANAAGRVGIDRSAIVFRLEETLDTTAPGAFVSMEGDPNDPALSGIVMRPVLDRIEHLYRSDGGSMEPLAFRLWPVDQETASQLTLRKVVPPAPGTQALPTYQTLSIQPLDPEREHVHYVTATVNNRPMQLVCLMDDEDAELPPVLPDKIRTYRNGRELRFEISLGAQGGPDVRYENVVILTMTEHQELTRENEIINWNDRPLNEGDIRTFYEMLATDDKALQRLQTFEQWGGEIVIEDLGWVPFTDWFTAPFKLSGDGRVLVIDDNVSPVEAAQYLTIALKQGLRYGPYRNFVMSTWGITEPDLDTWRDACEAMVEDMSISAASWAQVLPLIASIVNEPADFVISVHEVSKGDYAAAVGFLPFVPAGALSQGKKVLIQTTNATPLMHIGNQSINLIKSVMNPASNMTPQQAVTTLIQAGQPVNQRITNIQSGLYPPLPKLTKSSRRTSVLRQTLSDAGFPMPTHLKEGFHKPHVHHVLPFEHWSWFMAHGINVNDVEFLRWMRRSEHTNIHSLRRSPAGIQYNEWWRTVMNDEPRVILDRGTEYTADEIRQFLRNAQTEFNIVEDTSSAIWTIGN